MSNIIPFEFEGQEVRSLFVDDEPWWVGKDVCKCLGLNDHRQVYKKLDDDERGGYSVPTPRGNQEMICVNEPGLYRLIFSSRKASAERFKRWLSHEVLPTLRRTGTYSVPEKVTDFYAENLDPRDVTPANRKLVSAWTNCMREVRIAFGEEMARDFYNLSPLPKATGHVTENTRFMVEDGKACLEHMLSTGYTRRGDVPMGAMIEQALHVPSYRKVLSEGGVELNPVGYEGFVAFSIRHPRLERVFALTDWAYDWRTPLLTVPGVTLENICFQGTKKTRAILIPLHVIKGLSS